jgi:hypothetical protein
MALDPKDLPSYPEAYGGKEISQALANVEVATAIGALSSGAATSANQTTANTSLASIDGKIPTLVNGRLPVDVPGSGSAQGLAYLSTATITRAANTTPNE